MPKVYHLLPEREAFSEFRGGAISRWVANVLREDRSGVVVAASSDVSWQYPTSAVMVAPWLHVYRALLRLTSQHTPWLLRRVLLRWAYRAMLKELKPGDAVWVHNRPDYAAAICRGVHRAGATIVLHMHNAHLLTESRRILAQLACDRIVFVSRYLQQASSAAFAGPVSSEVLYNGADGMLFAQKTERTFAADRTMRVLFASRFVAEKGPHILSEALRRLHEQGVPIEGVVVGSVDFGSASLSTYANALIRDAPPNLTFQPYCAGKELAKLFHQADVFCLPSVWDDPFPLAPLEAMAAGLPVVATYSGGIPEALADGGGLLVERNSAEALAAALEMLVRDVALRQRLSEEGQRSFERRFRWSHVRSSYRGILEQLAHA